MRLFKFTLENYRSFKGRHTLETDGGISILVGPNGGGKSNLLDTALMLLRHHVFPSWVVDPSRVTIDNPLPSFARNSTDVSSQLATHHERKGGPQFFEIEVEVTSRDVENIQTMVSEAAQIQESLQKRYSGISCPPLANWAASMPEVGQKYSVSNQYQPKDADFERKRDTYLQYLQNFEWMSRLQAEVKFSALTTPVLSLPATRNAQGIGFDVTLANYTEKDIKMAVDMLTSKMAHGSISGLAIGRLAERYLEFLHRDEGNAMGRFRETEQAQGLTRGLKALGYSWELVATNKRSNAFSIQLTKAGRTFAVHESSSGEKEILIYLFAIFGLGVRDAVVFVDEPELHLHPRLQKKLFAMFKDLAESTGNQFILATHSPVFISPASIQYVSRVFSEAGESKILRLNDARLPNSKHLFNIVNSQNNEALFFADHVLLVEGLSDKIFFEKVLERFLAQSPKTSTIEVISVGGKGLFEAYAKVLDASKVPFSILADQDYLEQVGSSEVRKLLRLDAQGIKKHVIDDIKSRDGDALVEGIEKAIHEGTWEHAADIWNYIKSRRLRIRPELNSDEQVLLASFIAAKRAEGVYVLSLGSLESYLPEDLRSKDMEKLIQFLEDVDFWDEFPTAAVTELNEIFAHFLGTRVEGASESTTNADEVKSESTREVV